MTDDEWNLLKKKIKEVIPDDYSFIIFIVDTENTISEFGHGCPACMREVVEENFQLVPRHHIGEEKVH